MFTNQFHKTAENGRKSNRNRLREITSAYRIYRYRPKRKKPVFSVDNRYVGLLEYLRAVVILPQPFVCFTETGRK